MNSSALANAAEPAGLGKAAVTAILYATSLAVVALNVAPAMELQLRQEAELSVGQIGAIYFFELAAMGLATLPAYWWIARIDETRVAQWAYAVFIAGSLLSSWHVKSFVLLSIARAVTGAGAGSLMVLGMTAGARALDQNRIFALITLAQLASGAILLALLPSVMSAGRGLRGMFWLSAGLGVLGMLTARPFTDAAHRGAPAARTRRTVSATELAAIALAIAFAWVFNIVVGGLWAFAGEYGAGAGLQQERIAQVLTGGTVIGMAGAASAFIIGDRLSRRTLLLAGYLLIMLGAGILQLAPGDAGFAIGCCVLSFGWNFCVPYIFAAVASRDATGRSISSMNLAFAFGLAAGPLLAGAIIESAGLEALAPCALFGLALGTALMLRFTRQPAVPRVDLP